MSTLSSSRSLLFYIMEGPSNRQTHRYTQCTGPSLPDASTKRPGDIFIVQHPLPAAYARGQDGWQKWECGRLTHPRFHDRIMGISKPGKQPRVFRWLTEKHRAHLVNYQTDIMREVNDVLASASSIPKKTTSRHRSSAKGKGAENPVQQSTGMAQPLSSLMATYQPEAEHSSANDVFMAPHPKPQVPQDDSGLLSGSNFQPVSGFNQENAMVDFP
ncbi:hypothetical protein FA15DRAFT_665022 [Coprinopsis marcescibilis]|uniref:Uncharacterized protein n=1 Tax=Coprinopsis marcescibilis TaxID=230819 RepID=A0A5C3L723_COPMA|nr:hypothetical protein FA15DRAFT_665022 [Coprinopsis marcescibilis]